MILSFNATTLEKEENAPCTGSETAEMSKTKLSNILGPTCKKLIMKMLQAIIDGSNCGKGPQTEGLQVINTLLIKINENDSNDASTFST